MAENTEQQKWDSRYRNVAGDSAPPLEVLRDNAHVAKAVLRAAVPLVPEGPLPEN